MANPKYTKHSLRSCSHSGGQKMVQIVSQRDTYIHVLHLTVVA